MVIKNRTGTISIVTPSYNQGIFIEETITSVLSQEGNFFIEYIIADGGSTDQTIPIVKKYDQLLRRGEHKIKCLGINYRWWSKRDGGQSAAINKGFRLASGKILSWINSDDYYLPGTFQKIKELFDCHKDLNLVHGEALVRDEIGGETKIDERGNGDYHKLTDENFLHQSSTFFTKTAVERSGYLDDGLHFAMDYDLWIKIFRQGHYKYLNEPLSVYRLWSGAKTIAQHVKCRKELSIVNQRYHTKIIEPWLFYNSRTEPVFQYAKNKFPLTFKKVKKVFNYLNNRQRYLKG